MPRDITATTTNEFEFYCSILKNELSYVEDESFSWDDAVGFLIIQLKNTDSLNKARRASHSKQIQLTGERRVVEGTRKTEDFFPTLTLNSSFKSWRISIPVRINLRNIEQLGGNAYTSLDPWRSDSIQIRRRILNDDGQGNGNPTLQICYGDDLILLREQLNVDDYLVIVKHRAEALYDAFGVKSTANLGNGKNMYLSTKASVDNTSFMLNDLIANDDFENLDDAVEIDETKNTIRFETGLVSSFSCNRIIFGAPGTGKSFTINNDRKDLLGENNETDYERVTFHPDYSYANFVGTYKPVPCKKLNDKDEEEDSITYEYVPGPFMRMYVKALKNARTDSPKPFLLIIEEINRANVASVFGDVFQLLYRGDDNVSEYPIEASEDIKKHLARELGGDPENYSKIRIPDNMFIWATMNSADQGVYPMDTAFKRRWDFTYLGIDDSEEKLIGKTVILGSGRTMQKVEWNKLRKAINNFLAKEKINEDKQLGPYFIARNIIVPSKGDEIDRDKFIHTFKNKVLMYLFEDTAKQKRPKLFEGCFDNSNRYSEICREFDEKGIGIFHHDIQTDAEPVDLKVDDENGSE